MTTTPGVAPVPLLEILDLHVEIPTDDGLVRAVSGVTLSVGEGEVLGLVGESGSGKTMTVMSVLRLLPRQARVRGSIRFAGTDLLSMQERELRSVRGGQIGVTFQDPATYLNPVLRVGDQVAEVIAVHGTSADVGGEVLRVLEMVHLPRVAQVARMYPHELSGGMRQRILLAIAIAARPRLLIADEPTTALDVTIQAQILDLLRSLQKELGLAVILVTHDLGLVAEVCQRVVVMYAGKTMETADVAALFMTPEHPYTRGLMASTLGVHERRPLPASLPGAVPSLIDTPPGCVFHPRCPEAMARCATDAPPGFPVSAQHVSHCWLTEGHAGPRGGS